jgi:phospholipid/cholesterol/gamma-HCH transport system permease protein
MASSTPMIGWVGRKTIGSGIYAADLAYFIVQSLRAIRQRRKRDNVATARALTAQIIFSGVDALPIVTLLALAVGVSITVQILALGEALGTTSDVIRLLSSIVGMELGSLLTAIILIGRSGSAIAVDLGNMKLHGEVEALELLGINIMDFFVAPRVLGAAIAQLVLAVFFASIALFGGVLLSAALVSAQHLDYLAPLAQSIAPHDVLLYAAKNLLFGLIIAGTACFHALKVGTSPTEVPQQTQRAIATSQVLVFVIDGLFALAQGLGA